MTALVTVPITEEAPIWDLFFECDRPEVMRSLDAFLTLDPAGIVASYIVGKENPFGAAEWKKYFGVDIVDPPKLPSGFYAWWFKCDQFDGTKKRCETHVPPVLRPAGISLKKLEDLIKAPALGHPSNFVNHSFALIQNGTNEAGPSGWLVMRKNVVATGETDYDQKQFIETINTAGAGYQEAPSVIDLATVIFARHVCTGEKLFKATYSRAKETVYIEDDGKYQLKVGEFSREGLYVSHDYYFIDDALGIACLRKFSRI